MLVLYYWMLGVSWTASYEITVFHLSVSLSVCPSLTFLKIGLLVFSIVHDDNWPWYLVTDKARFFKKNWWPEFGSNGPKLGQKNRFFWHFLKFGSLVFLEIAYNFGTQIFAKGSRTWSETRFFTIFSSLVY